MIRAGELKLIKESQPHGVFETYTETDKVVFCNVRSVGRTEAYSAMSQGLAPELIFVLSNYAEYNGEEVCEFESVKYRIIRTYVNGEQIELTVERDKGNGQS